MLIDIDDEYKKLRYIQQIKPGNLRPCIILLCILITIISVGIPLILYWKWQRFRNVIHNIIFQQAEKDSQSTNYYLIVDSKKSQGKQLSVQYRSRMIQFRNFIISPYLVRKQQVLNLFTGLVHQQEELTKYIEHQNLKYFIKNNTLHSIKFKMHRDLTQCFQTGISPEQIDQSLKIYGKSGSFLLSFRHVFNKIIHTKNVRIVFMLFSIKKIVFGLISPDMQENSILVSLFIISQVFLAFLMILVMSIYGARQHNKIHDKIQNYHYEVIREGQRIEVKMTDLYVGDIVIPKKDQIIYFKGLIAGQIDSQQHIPYMIVNEKLYNCIDKPIQKTPILSHLNQISENNTINPGTLILNMDSKKSIFIEKSQSNTLNEQKIVNTNFYIIVMDNHFLQKFYTSYQQTCYFDNFSSIRKTFDMQQFIFQSFFFFLAIIGIIMSEMMEKSKENWFEILLSLIILCFPFNLALFTTFTEIISVIRLNNEQVSVINPSIEQIGISDHIFLELSAFQMVQFPGYIKKQRCARMALPQRFENSSKLFEIFRKAKEESIFTFLGWAGMMNLPYFDSEPIFKEIFQKSDFSIVQKSQYDEEQDSGFRVRNNDTSTLKINWKEHQRFFISQKFIQSIVVQDLYTNRLQSKYFVILEGEYTSEDCDEYFDQIVDEAGRIQYKEIMKRLYFQGKKIKYISLKRLNGNDKNFNISSLKRENLQKKLLFGGFLVFDHWPSQQVMKNLIQIDNISKYAQDSEKNVSIFSTRQQNALIGYDHILRKSKIFYQQQSTERVKEIQEEKSQYEGIVHIGNGILDRGSLLHADVSINKRSESYVQADFQMKKAQNATFLLSEGAWAMQTSTLTIICLSLFNFCKIIGQLVLFQSDHQEDIEAQPLSTEIDKLFLIDVGALIVPILLLNIYQPVQKLVQKQFRTFFRIDFIFHIIISLIGLLALFMIEFLDQSFQEVCNKKTQSFPESHQMFSRHYESHLFFNPHKVHSCEGIIDFVNISFSLIVIFLMDRQTESRKAKNFIFGIINKIYMVILWIGSIFYFHIPIKNVIRSSLIILALVTLVYVSDFLKAKKIETEQSHPETHEKDEEIKNEQD